MKKNSESLPREIWVMVCAAFSIALGYGIVAPVIPQFAKSFDVSNFAATLVVSAFAFMRLSFAPVSGWMSRRFGERNMFMTGILLVSLSSFSSFFATDYYHLLVYRGMGGIGSVTFSVAAMSLIFRWAPAGARGRASAVYGSGFLLGHIIGPVIGAFLAPLGFRPPFAIYGVFLLCAASIVKFNIPRHPDFEKSGEARDSDSHTEDALPAGAEKSEKPHRAGEKESSAAGREIFTVREALRMLYFRLILIVSFAHGWTNMGVRVAVAPLLAASIVNAPGWLAGGLLATFAVGNGIALLICGKWSDIYGRRPLILWGLFISGIFTVGMGNVTNSWILLGMSLAAGYGTGLLQPAQQGAVADIIGGRAGETVVSTFQQAGDFGQILGPVVAGLLIDHGGFAVTYDASAGILLAVALIWVLFDRRRRRS